MAELGGKPHKKDLKTDPFVQEITKTFGVLSERVKLIEQRVRQNTDRIRVIDESLSARIKEIKNDTDGVRTRVSDFSKEIEDMRETLRRVAKGMEDTARLGDVKVLERYINMIDFTRIVTKDDVERMIDAKIKDSKKR